MVFRSCYMCRNRKWFVLRSFHKIKNANSAGQQWENVEADPVTSMCEFVPVERNKCHKMQKKCSKLWQLKQMAKKADQRMQ